MTTKERPEGARSFARFLEKLADGDAHVELSEALHTLGAQLREEAIRVDNRVKGEITLKLAIEVEPNGVVAIRYDVKTKTPEAKRPSSVGWISTGGNLLFENPRQQKLPLREVGSGEVVDAEFEEPERKRGSL